jgi:hypothetical protein
MKSLRLRLPTLLAGGVLLLAGCQDVTSPVAPIGAPDDALASRSQVAHSAQELRDLFARVAPEVMALPQTVFADHEEGSGQLVFGVENGAAAFGVQRALNRLEVPGTAYTVRVVEPIHFANDNLRSRHRPTQGGIQIHWGQYVCTLGFNVDHPGGRSFITNSHCTNNQGTTGTTAYYQPLSSVDSSPIAIEADDPSYTRGGGCSAGKVCRYSDAARALYQSGTESTRGRIAKTTGENNGSLTVDGHFTVDTQDNTTTSFERGLTLHKVGRTTGWSSGNVTSTCATVNVSGSNIQLRCQTLVQRSGVRIVQGGDSGSPVFRPGTGDSVTLVGILWGGSSSGDLFVFSPLKNIQDELGSFTATASGGGDPPPGNGGGDNPPTIDTFQVSTSTTGPWNRATVTWAVSDPDGDLSQVRVELLSSNGSVLDSATISVSGGSASGETGLRSRTNPASVRLTVTDAAGNSLSQTEP